MKFRWFNSLLILSLLATGPVAADGPYCETARLTSTYNEFGRSVDISGDLAIVGAHSRDAIATIYHREATGEWVQEAILSDNYGSYSWDRYCNAVGISGDTVVVGSPYMTFESGNDGGCAVYRRMAPGDWQLEQKIAPVVSDSPRIGITAAIDGDRLILGSLQNPDGYVFIYEREGTHWSEAARFFDDGNYYYYSSFGDAVDINGDVAVIGEPYFGHSYYYPPRGALWTARRNGGSWNLSHTVSGFDWSCFAYNVAVDQSQIVAGAGYGEMPGNPTDSGYIYFRNDETSYMMTADNLHPNQIFGRHVAISGDRMLISSSEGLRYYSRDETGNNWLEDGIIPAAGEIALDGDTVICGNPSAREVRFFQIDSGYCPILDAGIFCGPTLGNLPATWDFSVLIFNLNDTFYRRFSQRIDVIIGNGTYFSNWRRGWDNFEPGSRRDYSWSRYVPELATLLGDNRFMLEVMDTTPVPYNQPPYHPSGEAASDVCSLTVVERTVGAVSLTCTPVAGTLPIEVQGNLEVENLSEYHRQISYRIDRMCATGQPSIGVASGWANIGPFESWNGVWSNSLPDTPRYQGLNTYSLHVFDVTPPPWNQPPYPPAISVHSLEDACSVTGYPGGSAPGME